MTSTSPTPIGQPAMSFLREGFVKFTPAQANTILKWCRYDRQRDERRARAHIATLAEYMRRGQWLEKSQLDFAILGKQVILVNGHHRMQAQIDAGVDILWSIVFHHCNTMDDVRGLYYRFDTNVRKRSSGNIIDGVGFADDAGLAKQTANALWNSAQLIGNDMRFRRYSQASDARNLLTDEQLDICHEYKAEAQKMEGYILKAPVHIRRKLRTTSMFALAMVILKEQPEKGEEFWLGLCEDDGLRKGDPRKTLLADMQSRTGRKELLAAGLMAGAKAWNAFYQGRDLKIIKVTGHNVTIDGTPYTVRA